MNIQFLTLVLCLFSSGVSFCMLQDITNASIKSNFDMNEFLKNNFGITIKGQFSAPSEEFPLAQQQKKSLRARFPSGGCNEFVQELNNQTVDHEQIEINHFFDLSTKTSSYLKDIALYKSCNEKLYALKQVTFDLNYLSEQVGSFSYSPHNETQISSLKYNIHRMKFFAYELNQRTLEGKKRAEDYNRAAISRELMHHYKVISQQALIAALSKYCTVNKLSATGGSFGTFGRWQYYNDTNTLYIYPDSQ